MWGGMSVSPYLVDLDQGLLVELQLIITLLIIVSYLGVYIRTHQNLRLIVVATVRFICTKMPSDLSSSMGIHILQINIKDILLRFYHQKMERKQSGKIPVLMPMGGKIVIKIT